MMRMARGVSVNDVGAEFFDQLVNRARVFVGDSDTCAAGFEFGSARPVFQADHAYLVSTSHQLACPATRGLLGTTESQLVDENKNAHRYAGFRASA